MKNQCNSVRYRIETADELLNDEQGSKLPTKQEDETQEKHQSIDRFHQSQGINSDSSSHNHQSLLKVYSVYTKEIMIPTITPFSLTGVKEKPNLDAKIEVKSWIQAIIRAIEEDLARRAPKCANRCCSKILPIQPKAFGWKKRMFLGRKEWLCDL